MPASARKTFLTPEQYLAIERAADFKSEYYDGQMHAMSGASYRQNQIATNLLINLGNQLRGSPCRPLGSDLRVSFGRGDEYTYPDVVVVCGAPRFIDGVPDTVANPRVIIEVLSTTTEDYDRSGKFAKYQRIASLRQYVLIRQDSPAIERYDRQPDDTWLVTEIVWPEGVLALDSIAASVSLREIYLDVFDPEDPE